MYAGISPAALAVRWFRARNSSITARHFCIWLYPYSLKITRIYDKMAKLHLNRSLLYDRLMWFLHLSAGKKFLCFKTVTVSWSDLDAFIYFLHCWKKKYEEIYKCCDFHLMECTSTLQTLTVQLIKLFLSPMNEWNKSSVKRC